MRLLPILFLPLSAMAAPPLDGPGYECERAVVRGEPGGAFGACSGPERWGDIGALAKAKAADELSRNQASASAALVSGLIAAERARRAAPGRVVEEALLQHLARVVRQLIPIEDRPEAAQWPLAGLPVPPPALPPLEDTRLAPIEASIKRSSARMRAAREF